MQDALEFVYQKSFKGDGFFSKAVKGTIDAHRNVPFIVSSVLPFPRFVANQMKFLYEHTPLLGLLNLEKIESKGYVNAIKNMVKMSINKNEKTTYRTNDAFYCLCLEKRTVDDDGK